MKQTFVIVGLGLLGGSLAGAIRKKISSAHVIGVSRDSKKIQYAKKKKLIHEGATLNQAVSQADYVFICTPVDTIPKIIFQIDAFAKPGAIVSDVGSTKSEIVSLTEKRKLRNIKFIGSHPLAGSHLTGIEHSNVRLFEEAVVFVTPSEKTSKEALKKIASFWTSLKSRVQIVSPQTHDDIVSEISHIPHAVAAALVQSVSDRAIQFASSGFLDTTRVAQGDPRIWSPIFLSNQKRVSAHLKRMGKIIARLIQAIERGSESELKRFLAAAASKRGRLRAKRTF